MKITIVGVVKFLIHVGLLRKRFIILSVHSCFGKTVFLAVEDAFALLRNWAGIM